MERYRSTEIEVALVALVADFEYCIKFLIYPDLGLEFDFSPFKEANLTLPKELN